METFGTKVARVDRCGEGILTVRLERPEGYQFHSGQWFRLFLDTREGEEARTFSHASAERDDWVELTTRLSDSSFKHALSTMGPGDKVKISASGGRLRLPSDAAKIAFLIGGVGITPVRSLLRDARQAGRIFERAVLLYGNRDATCEPYLEELSELGDIGVEVVRVLEHPPDGWEGERGFITAPLAQRHVEDYDDWPFVVAGPPVMVAAMNRVLDELGVRADQRIVEAFGSSKTPG